MYQTIKIYFINNLNSSCLYYYKVYGNYVLFTTVDPL